MTQETLFTPGQPPVRLAAIAYLGTIAFGLFAEVGTRSGLDTSDPAGLVTAIRSGESLYRLGLVSDLAMLVCYLIVTAVFYAAFRPYGRVASATAALFSLTGSLSWRRDWSTWPRPWQFWTRLLRSRPISSPCF